MNTIKNLKTNQEFVSKLYSPSTSEVYTPLFLVGNMLDKLPNDVWKNPNLKWCDPFCKSGIFLTEVIVRLFESLREWESDDTKRYNHIIQNMVYGFCYTDIGHLVTNRVLNDVSVKNQSIKGKFNIIVTNMPFNQTGNKFNTIWEDNCEKIMSNNLVKGGYLLTTVLPKWRKPKSDVWELFIKKNKLVHSKFYGINSMFKTAVDFVLVKKEKSSDYNYVICDVDDNTFTFSNKDWDFLPNCNFDAVRELTISSLADSNRMNVMKCEYIYDTHKTNKNQSMEESEFYKHPCLHTIHKGYKPVFYYTSSKRGHFGVRKVILSRTGTFRAYNDYKGKLGMTQHCCAIIVDNNDIAEKICKFINTVKFEQFVKKTFCWAGIEIEDAILFYLKNNFWEKEV
jgi:hypothetical protein